MSLRQKSVYATREVAHQWAKQSPLCARNAKHTLHYSGTVLYSYVEPIANLFTFHGKKCVLLTYLWHSGTTNRHKCLAVIAAAGLPVLTVEDMFIGKNTPCHAANLSYYRFNITFQAEIASQVKNRSWRSYHTAAMKAFVAEANQYAEFFGIERFSAPSVQ